MKTFFKPLKPASFFIFLSLMAGIAAGNYFFCSRPVIFAAILNLVVLLVFLFYYSRKKAFIAFLGLIFCLGFLLINFRLNPDLPSYHISNFLDSGKLTITGQVIAFTRHYAKKQQIIVLCRSVETKNHRKTRVTGKIKLNLYGFSDDNPYFGDILQFKSRIKSIRNFNNPGGFDYKKFLELKGIYGSCHANIKKIKILTQTDKITVFTRVLQKIEKIRSHYYQFVLDNTRHSDAHKILVSLITGKKEIIPSKIRELFSETGISHILAVSGLHLSIIGFLWFWIFYRVFSFFPGLLISGLARKMAGLFTIVPLIFYAVFSGFSPSAQRALIMIIVLLFSFISEKEKDIFSSLCFAGIIILFMDPTAVFSVSFQLSFIAVAFIMGGIFLLKKYSFLLKNNIISRINLMICVSFFAGLGTLPLTAHYFYMVSFIGPLSNLIAIPILGFVVLPMGLFSLACFSFFPSLALVIIHVCTMLIVFLIVISNFFISIPFSWIRTFPWQWDEIFVIYLFFISIYFLLKTKKKLSAFIALLSLLWLLCNVRCDIRGHNKSDSALKITIIDVGQGSSALIQTPENINILVDGGGFSDNTAFDTGKFIIGPFLWYKRIHSIDYVILTHPESDHLNGLIYILNHFKVRVLLKNNDKRQSANYPVMINICRNRNIRILNPLKTPDLFNFGRSRLLFFDSNKEKYGYDFNNNSLVFKVIYKEFSMLFPGDIQFFREKNLTLKNILNLHSDILLSPHHGSSTSSSKFFLDKVMPESVVISCGWHNRYGFPHYTVLKRYQKRGFHIFRTDEDGAVFISSDGKNHIIKTYIGE